MQTRFQYITMVKVRDLPKTSEWVVQSNSGRPGENGIGRIRYYPQWRQYCFFPNNYTVFSVGCLADINSFIEGLKRERL